MFFSEIRPEILVLCSVVLNISVLLKYRVDLLRSNRYKKKELELNNYFQLLPPAGLRVKLVKLNKKSIFTDEKSKRET